MASRSSWARRLEPFTLGEQIAIWLQWKAGDSLSFIASRWQRPVTQVRAMLHGAD